MGRRRKTKGQAINGWLIIDKPSGITSTTVVNRVRRLLDARKVGHGGTLDPLATGVLPLALGEATKTVSFVMEGEKTYRFTARWGAATSTDDAEGEVVETSDVRPERAAIEAVLPRFVGWIDQVPPAFSAIKVDGQRAYDLAREGETVELKARRVRIEPSPIATMGFSKSSAARAPICAAWPAISARRSAPADTSPSYAVWRSGPSTKAMRFRWTIWKTWSRLRPPWSRCSR
jgi:tRNA pseudouridine(55) synthase